MPALFCLVALTLLPAAEPNAKTLLVTVSAGKQDRPAGPVVVEVALPPGTVDATAQLRDATKRMVRAQLTRSNLLADQVGSKKGELHLMLPALKAGDTARIQVTLGQSPPPGGPQFRWKESPGAAELSFDGKPALRYECAALDDSTKEAREATFKVFHHLFDANGVLVTKGIGGKYTHHRGLFYGFRKTTYGDGKGQEVDTWHCTGDTAQVHEKTTLSEAGPLLGRHRVVIAWLGTAKKVFAREERELTVYDLPGGRLVEFASILRPVEGTVKVDGDPQHAGFHFRAADEVASRTEKQTIFIRPDGTDKPGATRNWPDIKGHVNLRWNAMSFVLGDQRYTAAYLDHPANPKEARYSEREYGRFGSYFVAEATPAKPLRVRYRLWLQRGQMELHDASALHTAFTRPPEVIVEE